MFQQIFPDRKGKVIRISSDKEFDIYDLLGKKQPNPVPQAGLYLVKFGDNIVKVIVD